MLRTPDELDDVIYEHKDLRDIVVNMEEGTFLIATDDDAMTPARFFPRDTTYLQCRSSPHGGFVFWLPLNLRDGKLVVCETDGSKLDGRLDLPPLPPKVMVQMYRALKDHGYG